LATYTRTISNLEKELKRRPQVLKIPPLNIASNPEVDVLKNSLKEKEGLIQIFKAEFENTVIQLHQKHNSEIEEYKNKLDSLKKENCNQDNKLNQKKMALLKANGKIRELKKEIQMLTK
jgi:cell fate (sporulation/competence/biofilm development) regulator YmcA (YheA/YmcA/DUF963 family)